MDGRPLAADRVDAGPQAGPGPRGAGQGDAGDAENKAAAGQLRLAFLDECGFSPSLPVTATWARRRERKRVPYENPQRRRLNAMVATTTCGTEQALYWPLSRRHLDALDLLHFLRELPTAAVPTVVVLDNANFHRAHDVRDARPDLWRRGIYLYYLGSYSPELNDIERLFRTVKHHELPERTYQTLDGLEDAVDAAFGRCEAKLTDEHADSPRKAA